MKKLIAGILISLAFVVTSCKHDIPEIGPLPILPDSLYNYTVFDFPEHFNSQFLNLIESTPINNITSDEGATLGRVIFYDKMLSRNHTISCSSCHVQEHGFSDPNKFSVGFEGGLTGRNSMHLVNHRFNRRLFWDLRAANLEAQVLMPIEDPLEMGMSLDEVIERMESSSYYPALFLQAFGTSEITSENISKALAQFIRSIHSYNAKYDEGVPIDFANFTAQELLGKELFFNGDTRCNQCHVSANFHLTGALNTGLDAVPSDEGYGGFSGDEEDLGKFRAPSLRNIALTAPYMHDGRFATLLEVVEHYNSGVQPHANLDDRVTVDFTPGGEPYQLNLSQEEKEALVAFLLTLTDFQLLQDPRYSDPFE